MYRLTTLSLAVLLLCPPSADAGFIDFESLNDLESVTDHFPGLAFSNTIVLTAGVSLNEFDFPPHSGASVVSDDGGPITILFSSPALSFSAYFTYVVPLSVEAFDSTNTSVGLATSIFSANDGFTGEPGSSPNEFLEVSSIAGISRLVITGDDFGGSFVIDDVTVKLIPEPGTGTLIPIFLTGLFAWRRARHLIT